MSKVENDWTVFKEKRKEVKNMLIQAKEEFIKGKLEEEKLDPKNLWRSLNDLTGFGRSKSKKGLSNILNDEGKLLDGADAANYMNNFYTTAGPKLATKFKNDWSEDQSKIKTNSAFSFEVISEDTVRRLCKDIKSSKSSAMGLLSTRILKDCFEVCTLELTHVFNTCLDSGIFPFSWGTGQITPIPKISVSNKKT